MNWLVELLDRMLAWLPRPYLIEPTEEGLRASHGRLKHLDSGRLYWYIPLFQDIKVFPVVEQTADVPPIAVSMLDDMCLEVSGVVTYKVSDVTAVLTVADDVDEIVVDVARTVLLETFVGKKIQRCVNDLRNGSTLEQMSVVLRDLVKRYGIHVIRFSVNELAPCSVIRVVGGQFPLQVTDNSD
jgi:hypothetical protein